MHAYDVLGFGQATGRDESLKDTGNLSVPKLIAAELAEDL